MLTLRQILKAARLMQTYGDMRPGFLLHEAASLSGPVRARMPARAPRPAAHPAESREPTPVGTRAEVQLVYGRDPLTGEYRYTAK